MRTGGMFSFDPYCLISTLVILLTFLRADNGSVTDIFRDTIVLPQYHDPSTVSGIAFDNITVAINDIVEKSSSLT